MKPKPQRRITPQEWSALHPDYRAVIRGTAYILSLDRPTGATILLPVAIDRGNTPGRLAGAIDRLSSRAWDERWNVTPRLWAMFRRQQRRLWDLSDRWGIFDAVMRNLEVEEIPREDLEAAADILDRLTAE